MQAICVSYVHLLGNSSFWQILEQKMCVMQVLWALMFSDCSAKVIGSLISSLARSVSRREEKSYHQLLFLVGSFVLYFWNKSY